MVFLARRALLSGALSAGVASALPRAALAGPIPPAGALRFNIVRKGKLFGQYLVAFASAGKGLTVTTDVTMAERIAGVTVFDYRHHCVETWRDGRFMELQSSTVRDRKLTDEIHAVRGDYEIRITTNKTPLGAPAGAAPLTHWNMATLSGPLFNPQDGRMLDVTARQVGRDPVLTANGAQLNAAHWALRGADQMDEWYDDAGVWAGLKGVLPDKSVMEYRRV